MAERLITMKDVRDRTSLSKTEIYRRINAGTFPRQVHIGPARVAFVEREVDAWMAARVGARECAA